MGCAYLNPTRFSSWIPIYEGSSGNFHNGLRQDLTYNAGDTAKTTLN
ncbi:MAG: hypothetical protein K0R59_179 [Sphingobacterium sp.]|jgi:hypothetical protein|nr:hypothetical protein [Sphingobacterium sp.]